MNHTLDVPGARLHYEIRGHGPLVVLVGAPMDAESFAPLADLLATDHTVLTTDPRGVHRSSVEDPDLDSTPALRADDLYRLLSHLDAGPATILGSSGGAVSALALVQAHPGLVDTLVAHEPPVLGLLPDRDGQRAATEDIVATYLAGDRLGAWRAFLAQANLVFPEPVFDLMFGGERSARQLADEGYWFTRELRPTTTWVPDLPALRASGTRVLIGLGEDSTGQLCDRVAQVFAAELGVAPTLFPGGHTGFVSDPAAFAVRLRAVLER